MDFWETMDGDWVRHHIQPRRMLFSPCRGGDGPDPMQLEDVRVTIKDGVAGSSADNWRDQSAAQRINDQEWTGKTAFKVRREFVETSGNMGADAGQGHQQELSMERGPRTR